MRHASAFYAAFARAGFLVPATWTPRAGGPAQSALVRFRRPSMLDGAEFGVIGYDTSASWPEGTFWSAKKGDQLDVFPGGELKAVQFGSPAVVLGGVKQSYRIKEVHAVSDGVQIRVELEAAGAN